LKYGFRRSCHAIPLAKDESGVYRIGKTRVTLDLIVHAFNRGATLSRRKIP
jgi:hypothetical protein